jgi:hypothetical protein
MTDELQEVQQLTPQQALHNAFFADEAVANPIENTVVELAQEQIVEPVQEVVQPEVNETPAFDHIAYLKETFGDEYADVEKIKSKITAPAPEPVYKQPEFVNEESKKLYEGFLAGDKKAIKSYLDKVELIESIPSKTPEEIVKLGWKEDLGLTDKQAERRFEKLYAIPDAELLDPEDKEIEEKVMAKQIANEAEKYKEYFQKYNTEIQLPSIQQQVPASTNQPLTEEAKRADLFAAELSKSFALDGDTGWEFKDEKSGLAFAGQVKIPQEELQKIKTQLSGHEDRYLAKAWFNQDGSAKEDSIARSIYIETNLPKIVNAAVADAVNQTRMKLLAENRNHSVGGKVISGDFQPDQKLADIAEFERIWGVPTAQ